MTGRATCTGFTLLEVVAAIALLSALTVAVLPLLVEATRCTVPIADVVDASDLRAFSDVAMHDDEMLVRIDAATEVRLPWKGAARRPDVTARKIDGAGDCVGAKNHEWVEFRCGDVRVLRYRRVEPPAAAGGEEPPP